MTARSLTAETALELDMELGEGAFWDAARDSLVWVDILRGQVHELRGGDHRIHSLPSHVGVAAPRKSGGWVLAVRDGFAAFDPEGEGYTVLAPIEVEGTRMNDGNVDPNGRFFAGSMLDSEQPGGGRVYCLDADLTVSVVLDSVDISNGIDWSPDGRTLYYSDSGPERTVSAFDFDLDSGAWTNRREFAHLSEREGYPDGLTVDADGCVWLAVWDGAQVRRYRPNGKLDTVVSVPAPLVTSCGFGGPGLDTLYITTARTTLSKAALRARPECGSLFAVWPGVAGFARRPFAG
jgi:sugar lactone lactonase YvrE